MKTLLYYVAFYAVLLAFVPFTLSVAFGRENVNACWGVAWTVGGVVFAFRDLPKLKP